MDDSHKAEELELEPETLQEQREEGSAGTLVDIRRPREREIVALEDDYWIPMQEVGQKLEELRDAPRPLVIYCHSGVRSLKVASLLQDEGFEDVYSLAGGIDAWAVKIDPSLDRY